MALITTKAATATTATSINASALPVGSVLQEIVSERTTGITFNSGSYINSGLEVTITPSYQNSKYIISVWASTSMNNSSITTGHSFQIVRTVGGSATAIKGGDWQNYWNRSDFSDDYYPPFDVMVVDTPNTTSAITYHMQGRLYGGSNGQWAFEANGGDHKHTLTVREIRQ
tara:strand:- start:45 stop:557 length:513 start_codon:yes stop_codon:yes gene_type:complete